MEAEDREDVQCAEKVILKRKLTGPPRLLLGKTRTRSVGEDRPETKRVQMDEDKASLKSSAAAAKSEAVVTETNSVEEEVLSEVQSSRGHSQDTGEVRDRKVNKRRWWRRFSSVVVCIRKRKKNVEGSLEMQQNALVKITEENNQSFSEEKKFNKRLTTSSETCEQTRDSVEKRGVDSSMTFQKKLGRFFTSGGRSQLSGVPVEDMEDRMKLEEAPSSSDAQVEKQSKPQSEESQCSPDAHVGGRTQPQTDRTEPGSEAVTVTSAVNIQQPDDVAAADSPEESKEQLGGEIDGTEEEVSDGADGSEMVQTDRVVPANQAPVGESVAFVSSDKDEVSSAVIVVDIDDRLSEAHHEVKTNQTSQLLQPSTNGPSIRIELVPPNNIVLQNEEEEEECWGGRFLSENQNHLLLLLGVEHTERQLLQTARSLVRAAMSAAVDQLSREQQSGSECIYREPQGCRDHA